VNSAQRAALALKLRAAKLTYDQIAVQLGFSDRSACRKAIQRELDRVVVSNVEELRREEGYMLDQMHTECWQLFMDKKNTYRLYAADRILSISEARRKLLNLDVKPDEIAANITVVREIPSNYLTEPLVESVKSE
jgi:hypothetical protein